MLDPLFFSPIVVKQNTKPTTTSAIKENIANFDDEAISVVYINPFTPKSDPF